MGAYSFRLTPDTRNLLNNSVEFFESLFPVLQHSKLKLKSLDLEARTEVNTLPSGEVEVAFHYPIDNNDRAADGRIFLTDRFIFSATEEQVLGFQRYFSFNGQGRDGRRWEAWTAELNEVAKNSAAQDSFRKLAKDFAVKVARSYSHPITLEVLDGFRGQVPYLERATLPARMQNPEYLLKVRDPQAHFNILRRGDELEVVLSLPIDDDADPPNGRVFFHDRFVLDAKTHELKSFKRSWTVAPEVEPELKKVLEEWAAQLTDAPSQQEANSFIQALLPTLLAAPGDLEAPVPIKGPSLPVSYRSPFQARAAALKNHSMQLQLATLEGLELMRLIAHEKLQKDDDARRAWFSGKDGMVTPAVQERLQMLFQKALRAAEKRPDASPFDVLSELRLEGVEARLRQQILSDPLMLQVEQISREPDPAFRGRMQFHLAREILFRKYGLVQSSMALAEQLKAQPEVQGKARSFLAAITGQGGFGERFELLLDSAAEQVASPSMLVAMMGAGFAGTGAELLGLKYLGQWGGWVWGAASVLGIGGEAVAFTGLHKIGDSFLQNPRKVWGSFGPEVLSGMLMFGALRLTHAGSAWVGGKLLTAKPSLGRRAPADLETTLAVSPLGRVSLPQLAWEMEHGVHQLLPAGKIILGAARHGGSIGAMAFSHAASVKLGLVPADPNATLGSSLWNAGVMYIQGLAGFHLAHRLSGGRLGPMLAEARVRLSQEEFRQRFAQLKAPPPPPTEEPTSPGFKPFKEDHLPDIRLFDLAKETESDFSIGSDHPVFVDHVFFGISNEKIQLKKDAQGNYFIHDGREVVGVQPAYEHAPAPLLDLNLIPLLLNSDPIPNHQDVPLNLGDTLRGPSNRLIVGFPKNSALLGLSMLGEGKQQKLFRLVEQAERMNSLLGELLKSQAEGAVLLHGTFREVLAGRALLYSLPVELGIFAKFKSLIKAELRTMRSAGFDDGNFSLKEKFINPRWSPLELEYHLGREMLELDAQIKKAKNFSELREAVASSKYESIEGLEIEEIAQKIGEIETGKTQHWEALPSSAGLRQKGRDLLEDLLHEKFMAARQEGDLPLPEDPDLRREFIRLDDVKHTAIEKIRKYSSVQGRSKEYDGEELEELAYQVLERGRPLALLTQSNNVRSEVELYQTKVVRAAKKFFPEEMSVERNPYTAEPIVETQKETEYRLALHILNDRAGRLIFGTPSQLEVQTLIEFVQTHLEPDLPADFYAAKFALRHHLDTASPKARGMLRHAGPEEKAMILENYFGPFRRRELPPADAFQVAAMLGQVGLYREVGVTYSAGESRYLKMGVTLTLGDLSSVASQGNEFFLVHTHSEEYLTPDGRPMGLPGLETGLQDRHQRTVAMKVENQNPDTRNVLPSAADLRIYMNQAKAYWSNAYPKKFGDTPLFELKSRTYKNWVVYSLGTSQIQISLSETGQIKKIFIQYGFKKGAKEAHRGYRFQRDGLEKLGRELGLPIELREVPLAELVGQMPFPFMSYF